MISRRRMLGLASASGLALAAPRWLSALEAGEDADDDGAYKKGRAFLTEHISVDVHAHPGRFFLSAGAAVDPSLSPLASHFAPEALADMLAGGVTAACFSTVGDLPALQATPEGGLNGRRALEAGALYRAHRLQLASLREILAHERVSPVLNPGDLERAHERGRLGAILAVEGADFLEGDLGRLEEAHDQGVRLIAILHYRPNDIGDLQTEPARHDGLTAYGAALVRELDRLGIVIDLAHAAKSVVRQVCEITGRPVIASHTNLEASSVQHPRLIDAEYAAMIAGTGGLIGAWPAGIGVSDFGGFVDNVLRLVEAVGAEHVGIGTDMDANYRPVFADYEDWPLIPAALLARGMSETEVAAVMGGNFARVFAQTRAGA